MRLPRRPSARDRRPSRLGPSQRAPINPDDLTGIESLGLVVAVYGAERLTGRGQKRASDRAFRDAARRLAIEARARDAVRGECMLINLRSAWMQLPAVQRVSDAGARRSLWDRLVRLCCEEFYAPAEGSEASTALPPWGTGVTSSFTEMSAN